MRGPSQGNEAAWGPIRNHGRGLRLAVAVVAAAAANHGGGRETDRRGRSRRRRPAPYNSQVCLRAVWRRRGEATQRWIEPAVVFPAARVVAANRTTSEPAGVEGEPDDDEVTKTEVLEVYKQAAFRIREQVLRK